MRRWRACSVALGEDGRGLRSLLRAVQRQRVMLGFGSVGGLVYQEPDLSDVLISHGLILWGVVLLLLNYWTTFIAQRPGVWHEDIGTT